MLKLLLNKKILLLLILSLGLIGNSYAQICNEDSNVQKRNGVVFLPNKIKPFSGQNLCIYDNEQYKVKGEFTEGLKDGNWTYWAKSGIKKTEEIYRLGTIQAITIFSSSHYQKLETIIFADDGKSEFKKTIWDYYPNGNISEEKNFQWGEMHGFNLIFYEGGQIREKGEFFNGDEIGIHYSWYENGQKEYEAEFQSGVANGVVKKWDEAGKLIRENYFKNDEIIYTTYYSYFANGQLQDRYTHEKDDSKEWKNLSKFKGERVGWYENGQKRQSTNYKDGLLNGRMTSWYENGQLQCEGGYKNDEFHGKTNCWSESGQLRMKMSFKEGKYDGRMTYWYPSGALQLDADYIDNSAVTTFWHENGVKAGTMPIKDGMINGIVIEWYENGSKRRIGNYLDNLPDGKQTHYYTHNNQKKLVFNCSNGTPFGDVQGWRINGQEYYAGGFKDENGKLLALHANGNKQVEIYYKDGAQISTTYWDKNKVKTVEYIYEDSETGYGISKNTYIDGVVDETSYSYGYDLGLCSGYEPFEQGALNIKY